MLFNVFSNYMQPLVAANIVKLTDKSKPSEVFNQLRIAYNQGVKGIEDCIRLFVPNPEEDEELFEYICFNENLRPIIRRANQHILLHIGVYSYPTLYVNMRIINSMMEKLVLKGKLKKDVFCTITSSLVKNVNELYAEVATEDLPF